MRCSLVLVQRHDGFALRARVSSLLYTLGSGLSHTEAIEQKAELALLSQDVLASFVIGGGFPRSTLRVQALADRLAAREASVVRS